MILIFPGVSQCFQWFVWFEKKIWHQIDAMDSKQVNLNSAGAGHKIS